MKNKMSSFNYLFKIKSSSRIITLLFLIFVASLHIFTFVYFPLKYGKNIEINGYVDENFKNVYNVFNKNFIDGFERDGANYAVFHKGEMVVNLWAGMADSRHQKKWTQKTKNILFSVTKPLSGLCIAILVDQGIINYDDPVSKYWPEFGQNGKENTTIRQVLSHEAGLPYIEKIIDFEDAEGNATNVLKLLAAAKPLWTPGKSTGYHPVTFGWLVDGIIRGADPLHRTLKTFFKEEVANKYNIDISIGSEKNEINEISHLTNPTITDFVRDIVIDPRIIFMYLLTNMQPTESIINRVSKNPRFIDIDQDVFPFNNPKVQQLSIGSATGLSNAYNLAKLFSLMIEGKIISKNIVKELSKPTIESWHYEKTVIYPIMKGHGFFYDYHPQITGKYTFGHPGYGCQGLHIDPEKELVIVYLTNGLKTATSCLCFPYQKLIAETYRAIN